jgi:hypothetical protein
MGRGVVVIYKHYLRHVLTTKNRAKCYSNENTKLFEKTFREYFFYKNAPTQK